MKDKLFWPNRTVRTPWRIYKSQVLDIIDKFKYVPKCVRVQVPSRLRWHATRDTANTNDAAGNNAIHTNYPEQREHHYNEVGGIIVQSWADWLCKLHEIGVRGFSARRSANLKSVDGCHSGSSWEIGRWNRKTWQRKVKQRKESTNQQQQQQQQERSTVVLHRWNDFLEGYRLECHDVHIRLSLYSLSISNQLLSTLSWWILLAGVPRDRTTHREPKEAPSDTGMVPSIFIFFCTFGTHGCSPFGPHMTENYHIGHSSQR